VDCFRAQAGWSALDFFGGGRSLNLDGSLSKLGVGSPVDLGFEKSVCRYDEGDFTSDTLNYSLSASLFQPSFLSSRNTASLTLLAERRSEYNVYVRQDVGANVGVVFNAHRDVPFSVSYGISVGRTVAQPVTYCQLFLACAASDQALLSDRRRFAAVTATAVRNDVNSILDPSRGSQFTLTLTHASRFVGSDPFYEFNRGEVDFARYVPLGSTGVFAWRVRGGVILPQRITLSGQNAQFVPPDQRFYAGGPNSVRGYGRNDLGPIGYVISDTTSKGYHFQGTDTVYNSTNIKNAPIGGNAVFVMNAELRFATPILPDRMRVALFADLGQVWERGDTLAPVSGVRFTPGVGLRFTTPLGPVRLDAAYQGPTEAGVLYLAKGDTLTVYRKRYQPPTPSSFWKRWVLQFAVGQAF
jgi:outer membrane protein assembly factor BamA